MHVQQYFISFYPRTKNPLTLRNFVVGSCVRECVWHQASGGMHYIT